MKGRAGRIPWKDILLGFAVISFFCISPDILPVFGDIINLFTPAAILFFLVKLGGGYGLVTNALVLLFTGFLWPLSFGPVNGFWLEFFLLGAIFFELLKKNFSAIKTVAYSTGILILFFSTILIVWTIQTGKNPTEFISSTVDQTLTSSLAFYRSLNLPASTMEALLDFMGDMKRILVRFWAGFAGAFVLVFVWMNVWVAAYALRRYNLQSFEIDKLSHWSLPEHLVWLVILSGGLSIVPHAAIQAAGISLLIFLGLIYFFQGVAIISFYLNKYKFSRAMRILFYVLISIQTYMIMLVAAVGLLDLWVDFRRLRKVDNGQTIV